MFQVFPYYSLFAKVLSPVSGGTWESKDVTQKCTLTISCCMFWATRTRLTQSFEPGSFTRYTSQEAPLASGRSSILGRESGR